MLERRWRGRATKPMYLPLRSSVAAILRSHQWLKDFLCINSQVMKQSSFALILSISAFVPGLILAHISGLLVSLPGLIMLVPGKIAMRGNIFGTMAARLGTKLHVGEMPLFFRRSQVLKENFEIGLVQTIVMSLILAVLVKVISFVVGMSIMSLRDLVFISLFGGLLSSAFLFIITTGVAIFGFKRGIDPDNVTIPLVTALGDIITLPCVVLAAYLLLMFHTSADLLLSILMLFALVVGFLSLERSIVRSLMESIPVFLLCALIGAFSGSFLESSISTLAIFPAMLVLLPVFNEEAGNLGGILSSRLTSAAYLGLASIGMRPDSHTRNNFLVIFFLGLVMFPLLGMTTYMIATALSITSPSFSSIFLISTSAGMVITLITITTAYYLTYLSYRLGLDPDNVVVPLITNLMDLTGTGMIVILMFLLV